ncbi:conserved hypothetical protein [Crenothrix polyspora]|uniref:DUF3455 domain-containing protein n=1 Tax=Crenothrix polyspora TaxID=360316 RepID=A0A1R4H6L0_9GAMM|nr:DUF3455 domain-containing protein [Crenothrix polyspora]SJM91816.1 conserved hypothetical protein [Crenothrix polyspora]
MVNNRLQCVLLMAVFSPLVIGAELVIPGVIQVPSGNTPLFTLHATGEQIYQCALKDKAYKWIVYPNALLMDEQGQKVGTHSKGPAWQYKDGSRVTGKISQKTDEPRDKAMPWLLIEAVDHKGSGLLSTVSYINRVNTQGGLEPMLPCDGNHLGSEKPVAYTADYIFYAR